LGKEVLAGFTDELCKMLLLFIYINGYYQHKSKRGSLQSTKDANLSRKLKHGFKEIDKLDNKELAQKRP
jgi:hypothetical protein